MLFFFHSNFEIYHLIENVNTSRLVCARSPKKTPYPMVFLKKKHTQIRKLRTSLIEIGVKHPTISSENTFSLQVMCFCNPTVLLKSAQGI